MDNFIKGIVRFLIFDLVLFGVIFLLAFRMTKNVDVTWKPEHLQTAMKKAKVIAFDMNKLNLTDSFNGRVNCYGEKPIDESFTNEEVSAILSSANNEKGPIRDIKIKFLGNNELEANVTVNQSLVNMVKEAGVGNKMVQDYGFMLDSVAGTPMYIRGRLKGYKKNGIELAVRDVNLGNIPLGEAEVRNIQTNLNNIVNYIIPKYKGFSIEYLKLETDKLDFKGTLPSKID